MKFAIMASAMLLILFVWYQVVVAIYPFPDPVTTPSPVMVVPTSTPIVPTPILTRRADGQSLLTMPDVQAILVERHVVAQLSDVRCAYQKDWNYQQEDFYFCTPRDGAVISDPNSGQALPFINVNAHTGRIFWNDQSNEPQPTVIPGELPSPGEVDKNFL